MKTRAAFLFLLLLSASAWNGADETKLSATDVAKKMFLSTKNVNTLRYTMKKKERFGTEYREMEVAYKYAKKPLKVYFIQNYPKQGMEVLFSEGGNNNKLLINTNGFPWVNVSLDPLGSKAREGQHHTIYESGFEYFTSIMEHLFSKYGTQVQQMVHLKKNLRFEGMDCYHIELINPHFKYVDYKVLKGEDLIKIARKMHVSEYMILEKNGLDGFDDVQEGQTIKVPNDYAPKLEMYVEQKYFVPVMMRVYDGKGVFEQYEYSKLEVNPYIGAKEFARDFEGYGF